MNLTKREGNVYLSPDRNPKATAPCPQGAIPNWSADSQENYDSWWDVFVEMARPAQSPTGGVGHGSQNRHRRGGYSNLAYPMQTSRGNTKMRLQCL